MLITFPLYMYSNEVHMGEWVVDIAFPWFGHKLSELFIHIGCTLGVGMAKTMFLLTFSKQNTKLQSGLQLLMVIIKPIHTLWQD